MRRLGVVTLVSAVLAGTAPAGEEAQPAGVPLAAEGDYRVTPSSAGWSSQVYFEGGAARRLSRRMHVHLTVEHPEGITPVSLSRIVADEVVTDAGERLKGDDPKKLPAFDRERRIRKWGFGRQPKREFSVSLNMDGPVKPLKGLKSVRGSFVLEYTGEIEEVDIGDPRKLKAGTEIPNDKLEGREIVFEGLEAKKVRFSMSVGTDKKLSEARFYDADGKRIRSWGSGMSSDGRQAKREYQVGLPEGGKVVFHFHGQTKKVKVPIELKDLSLEPAAAPPPPPPPPAARGAEVF